MYYFKLILVVVLLSTSQVALSSDPIDPGLVSQLSYRGGYVTFKVVGDDGKNYCDDCEGDPGGFGTKVCWIEETKKAQISILLFAIARGKKIYGRVSNSVTSCKVYQMTIQN